MHEPLRIARRKDKTDDEGNKFQDIEVQLLTPENLNEAIDMFGNETVFELFKRAFVEDHRALIRDCKTTDEAAEILRDYIPKAKDKVSEIAKKLKKALGSMTLTPAERAQLLDAFDESD